MGKAECQNGCSYRRLRLDGHLLLSRLCLHRLCCQHVPRHLQSPIRMGPQRAVLHSYDHGADPIHRANQDAQVSGAVLRFSQCFHRYRVWNCPLLYFQRHVDNFGQGTCCVVETVAGLFQVSKSLSKGIVS